MPTPARIVQDNLPVVVLIGRANVGKSTLFNRLTEQDKALVSDIAGTTRTNNEGDVLWRGKYIHLIDTGGQDALENEQFAAEIVAQAETALLLADVILFVVDGRAGLLPQERDLARRLQKLARDRGTELVLVANKIDNHKQAERLEDPDWLKLALGQPVGISAASGYNLGDLLDDIYRRLQKRSVRPKQKKSARGAETIRVALIGKPNVGKSSLFNKLIGQDRVIVSDVAHTTREPYDTEVTYTHDVGGKQKNEIIVFVDTAGVRRKAKVSGILERGGIHKTIDTIEKSDIILLVLDGSEPLSSQDLQLGGLIKRRSKSVVIVLNKWDKTEDNSDSARQAVIEMIYHEFPHLDFAPIIFTSGKTGYRIHDIFPLLVRVMQARKTTIPPRTLETFLETITREHRPARGKGTRHPKILGFTQVHSNPPIFEAFIKYRTSIHRSYLNYIKNRLREQFDFLGTPIVIKMTKLKRR